VPSLTNKHKGCRAAPQESAALEIIGGMAIVRIRRKSQYRIRAAGRHRGVGPAGASPATVALARA
jgi:hypothetical protein